MTHILLIQNMKDEADAQKIDEILERANIRHHVSFANKSVSVDQRGDMVKSVQRILEDAGYHVL